MKHGSYNARAAKAGMEIKQGLHQNSPNPGGRSASEARAEVLRKMGLKPEQHRDPALVIDKPLTRKG